MTTTPTKMDAAANATPEKQFHGWRLLGVLSIVMALIALVCVAVDLLVIPR